MRRQENEPIGYVIGPQGTVLTPADLPSTNIIRWTLRRKAELVAAVRGGLLTFDEASGRYSLTIEEFASWQPPLRIDSCAVGRPAIRPEIFVAQIASKPQVELGAKDRARAGWLGT